MRHRHLAAIAAVVLAIPVAGCSGSTPSAGGSSSAVPSAAAPAPTASPKTDLVTDVDVGGRTLHLVCVGPLDTGEPTVVFEAGLEAPFVSWSEVLSPMQFTHRACAYDRAGLGASPPAAESTRTSKDIVKDLHTLLTTAKLDGPYVMVGHSMAAWPLAVYVSQYPDDVVGVVLVDPRGPKVSAGWRDALPAPTASGSPSASEDPAVAANRDELSTFDTDPSRNAEHINLTESAAEANAVLDAEGPLFGDRPLVVLGAADTHTSWADLPADIASVFGKIWLDGQKALAAESTAGSFVSVPDSNHEIQFDQPAVVVQTIEGVLAALDH
jgi:pimeloyl-ACP methyl ester carboxylesterase